MIAESDQEFVAAICRILEEPSFASDLSKKALAFAGTWNDRHIAALRKLMDSAPRRD
jgi:hypothetical protein